MQTVEPFSIFFVANVGFPGMVSLENFAYNILGSIWLSDGGCDNVGR